MATWTPETKHSSTFSNASKSTGADHLLMETGDRLLLETGDSILLESTSGASWLNATKN